MTMRSVTPAILATIGLVWTTTAYADPASDMAKDAKQKGQNTANAAASDACNHARQAASHDKTGTAMSAHDAACPGSNGASYNQTTNLDTSSSKAKVDAATVPTEVQTSKVETTSANVFAAEQPTKSRPNKKMLEGSAALLGLAYVPSAIVGLASPKGTDSWMALPVAGPWIALAEGSAARPWTGDVAIAASGVVQGVAAIGIITSFVVPEKDLPIGMNSKLRVTPTTMGQGGYGVGAGGTF